MRPINLSFLAHITVGFAAVAALYLSAPLQDAEAFLLWFFGVPWLAGFVAFFAWPRRSSALAWMLPGVTLLIGAVILVGAEWAAAIG